MATTVAKLEAQVVALTAALDVLITRVAELEATRSTQKRVAPCGTTQTFPSPREAMEACKALVAKRDGNRYSVTGNVLHIAAR